MTFTYKREAQNLNIYGIIYSSIIYKIYHDIIYTFLPFKNLYSISEHMYLVLF